MAGLTEPQPFRVALDGAAIADLRRRLAATLWAEQPDGAGWRYGLDDGAIRDLCAYWADGFDWAGHEARLNAWPQFRAGGLHFYHIRSPRTDAVPLILAHGWPGGAIEFLDVVAPLIEGTPAFHLVIPTMPGFGHSAPSPAGLRARDMAASYAGLMEGLGYGQYLIHGTDKGVRLAIELAAFRPDAVMGLHLSLLPAGPPDPPVTLPPEDEALLARDARFREEEMAYQALQRTKPHVLAAALTDSPAGLAAWLADKYRCWTDCDGDLAAAMPRDRMLDLISTYWLTGTIGSSMRSYHDEAGPGRQTPLPPVRVPVAHSRFPAEIVHTPRAWAEPAYDIAYWNDVERGGHFPAIEVPALLVRELRAGLGAILGRGRPAA